MSLQIDEQLLPALTALPHARLKADQLLLALRRGAHQHQHAFGLRLHARRQIDAVRADVDVMARRQIAPSSHRHPVSSIARCALASPLATTGRTAVCGGELFAAEELEVRVLDPAAETLVGQIVCA